MASHTPLEADATLRSVLSTLDDEVNFVPDAYAVIHRYNRQHGPVVLRLGVSRLSKGKRPNYRIDDAKTGNLVAVIDGNNHQPWTGEEINLTGAWSTAAMSHAEVQELLAEVREKGRAKSSVR